MATNPNVISPGTSFGVSNVIIPEGGPKCVPLILDFTNTAEIELQGELITAQGFIEYVQGAFVDNRLNSNQLTLVMGVTGQTIVVAPNSQGYYNFLVPNPPFIRVSTTQAAIKVPLSLYNVPIQSQVWSTNPTGIPAAGISVSVVAQPGAAYVNRSIANLSGASEQLMPANLNRKVLVIHNPSANPMAVNLVGGAAALNTAGSVEITAGGSIVLDSFPPTGIINIIGTLNDDVTAYEG